MNIVITGAGKGIGFQTALLLSGQDHGVIAISRNKMNLQELQAESKKRNPSSKLITFIGDVTEENSVEGIANEVKTRFQKVDIVINNAGLLISKPFADLELNEWQQIYSTNIFGAVNVTRTFLPMMHAGSHIVNISSMGGFQGSIKFKGLSAYSSSKAALVNLTECLAEELKDKKIAVNCLCLGSVQTNMFSEAFPGMQAALSEEKMAKYVAQFAVEGHHYFNGKVIPVSNSTP